MQLKAEQSGSETYRYLDLWLCIFLWVGLFLGEGEEGTFSSKSILMHFLVLEDKQTECFIFQPVQHLMDISDLAGTRTFFL